MPGLRAPECKKTAFLAGALLARPRGRSHSPGVLGRCSTRFCDRNSGWRNQHVYCRANGEPCRPADYPSHLGVFGSEPDYGEDHVKYCY